jgi:hypothetical protein
MPRHTCILARDDKRAWTLEFIPEELHLYVTCARHGRKSPPSDWMTIEDFLNIVPLDELQRVALRNLIAVLKATPDDATL